MAGSVGCFPFVTRTASLKSTIHNKQIYGGSRGGSCQRLWLRLHYNFCKFTFHVVFLVWRDEIILKVLFLWRFINNWGVILFNSNMTIKCNVLMNPTNKHYHNRVMLGKWQSRLESYKALFANGQTYYASIVWSIIV